MIDDTEHLVSAWPGVGRMEVRCRLRRFKGRTYFDLRQHVRADDGETVPTRKGLCLPVEDLGRLADAVAEARHLVDDGETVAVKAGPAGR